MKRIIFSWILILSSLLPTMAQKQHKVEVYYFHFTRRCVTCNAVEEVSKSTVNTFYAAQLKSGVIQFTSLNLDDKASVAAAQKCKAEGQALIVMGNGKRIDLTEKAFMYARSNPEKLKAELKKAIDSLSRN